MKNMYGIIGMSVLACAVTGWAQHGGHDPATCCHGMPVPKPAPIGVMGDHYHRAGEVMASYRFMMMHMEGMRDGTSRLSTQDVFDRGFAVSPKEMDMSMHMIGVMWAPVDRVTLMAMVPYIEKKADLVTAPGTMPRMMRGESFRMRSSGWGDTTVSAIVPVHETAASRTHLNLGVSLPTGSVNEKDAMGPMPFSMQTGSGTYDLKPGATYAMYRDAIYWGVQASGTVRLDDNRHGYTFGDGAQTTSWITYGLRDWISVSGRIRYEWMDSIDGDDKRLMERHAPAADPKNYGGQWLEAGVGLTLRVPRGVLQGHRVATELLWPVYQDLNGPQMERDYTLVVGWQKAW